MRQGLLILAETTGSGSEICDDLAVTSPHHLSVFGVPPSSFVTRLDLLDILLSQWVQ
jgi:hypothetical protein